MADPDAPAAGHDDSPPAAPRAAGRCHVLLVYDVGFSIDLDEAARRLAPTHHRLGIVSRHGAPGSLRFDAPPLALDDAIEPITVGRHRTDPAVEIVLYDFGAVSLRYAIAIDGPFDDLLELSGRLYDNAALLADSRRCVDKLLAAVGPAVSRPDMAAFVEDYLIFEVRSLTPAASPATLLRDHGPALARILRAEAGRLSRQEVRDALACRMSFGPDDLVLIDWYAALVVDRDADDVRDVLAFANVELLEMRHLDHKLDRALEESQRRLTQRPRRWTALRSTRQELHRIAELQMESAVLFEQVNNTLKLVGDEYLARVYRLASRRLHLDDWDASILRKLQTIESIYSKMSDRQATLRMETLEWIIIALITISIVLPFLGLGH